jgi:uncharacterized coiled-coil DUF342 family protein
MLENFKSADEIRKEANVYHSQLTERITHINSIKEKIQEPDGTRRAVSPEEAKEFLKNMPLERRKLYESVPDK